MSPRKSKTDPEIIEMPPRKMAVVSGKGNPQEVFGKLMPGLYKTLYTLKFDLKKKGDTTYKVSAACARYLDANIADKDDWSIYIGIPVPDDTVELPAKVPAAEICLETWEYGTVGQILHIGAYDKETETITRLLKHIEDEGYDVVGVHEEEYLTTPKAKVMKTLIRYPVRKKKKSK
jgi:hypothetical protein